MALGVVGGFWPCDRRNNIAGECGLLIDAWCSLFRSEVVAYGLEWNEKKDGERVTALCRYRYSARIR